MTGPAAWHDAAHVLAIRLDAMGDLLMTTPALRALKHARPGRRLTLLTSPAGAAAAALIPDVDGVIVYEAPWMKATPQRTDSRTDRDLIERLRREQFAAAVIFTVSSQNPLPAALVAYLADIPLRLAHCRENSYQLLTDRVPEPEPNGPVRHEVRRQLDLVAAVGGRAIDPRLSLRVPDRARAEARRALRRLAIGRDRPWVLIHPGATAPSRRYAPEGFAEAADHLAAEGIPVAFVGGPSEMDLVESIRRRMTAPSPTLAGSPDLAGLAALIERAPLLIANNSGPAHVAAAVGTPVVSLYALTNPQHTPWGVPCRVLNHAVPCGPCFKSVCPEGHHDCLRLVPPAAVARAAMELLDETRAPRLAANTP